MRRPSGWRAWQPWTPGSPRPPQTPGAAPQRGRPRSGRTPRGAGRAPRRARTQPCQPAPRAVSCAPSWAASCCRPTLTLLAALANSQRVLLRQGRALRRAAATAGRLCGARVCKEQRPQLQEGCRPCEAQPGSPMRRPSSAGTGAPAARVPFRTACRSCACSVAVQAQCHVWLYAGVLASFRTLSDACGDIHRGCGGPPATAHCAAEVPLLHSNHRQHVLTHAGEEIRQDVIFMVFHN